MKFYQGWHGWFGLVAAFFIAAASCATGADEPGKVLSIPQELLSEKNWPSNWPSIRFPGPIVSGVNFLGNTDSGLRLEVSFLLASNGLMRGLDITREDDRAQLLLGKSMADLMDFQVTEAEDLSRRIPIKVVSIQPAQLTAETNRYQVEVAFDSPQAAKGRKLKISADTIYRKKQSEFRSAHAKWLDEQLPTVLAALKTENVRLELEAKYSAIKGLSPKDTNLIQTYWKLFDAKLRSYFDSATNGSLAAANAPKKGDTTFYLTLFNDITTRMIVSNVVTVADEIAAQKNGGANQFTLSASQTEELCYLMEYRLFRAKTGTAKREGPNEPVIAVTPVTSRDFTFDGRIAGFSVLVEKFEPLQEVEVASVFGRGMANHFYVFRVTFLNTNAMSVLLYGDQMKMRCKTRLYEYHSPRDYKRLIRSVPAEDLYVTTNSTGPQLEWRTSRNSNSKGKVIDDNFAYEARPFTLDFLIRGHADREFHTTKAWVYRGLDVAGSTAAALIPFVGNQSYSDGAGIFSGIFVPAVKTLFGNATEVQKQAFLLESMPSYLELERGNRVSKYIYFSKHGTKKEDSVLFISDFGKSQEFEATVALLLKAESANK